MSITNPILLHDRYRELFKVGDLVNLLNMYEMDGVMFLAPGQELRGHEQIRVRLKQLVGLRGEFKSAQLACVRQGDVALLQAEWSLRGKTPKGGLVVMGGVSTKLARRGTDGFWRYAIDFPVNQKGI
jgi:ketosteroid isomerase-like protein